MKTLSMTLFILLSLSFWSSYASIYPQGETEPYKSSDDYFDDPAIWVTKNPEESLILGTHKKEGVFIYNLKGKLLHIIKKKNANNIDTFSGFNHAGSFTEGAALSIKGRGFQLFSLSSTFPYLKKMSRVIPTRVRPYGICSMIFKGNLYLSVTGKKRNAQIFVYQNTESGFRLKTKQILSIKTKNEGCVFNPENGDLFIAEEERGLWKWNHSENKAYKNKQLIAGISNFDLASDLEGVTLYNSNGVNLIIVSVQSKNTFAVFDLEEPHRYKGQFSIGRLGRIDGVSHTDGIASTSLNLGPLYPKGLFVVQDDENREEGEEFVGQNFKLVSWERILFEL